MKKTMKKLSGHRTHLKSEHRTASRTRIVMLTLHFVVKPLCQNRTENIIATQRRSGKQASKQQCIIVKDELISFVLSRAKMVVVFSTIVNILIATSSLGTTSIIDRAGHEFLVSSMTLIFPYALSRLSWWIFCMMLLLKKYK